MQTLFRILGRLASFIDALSEWLGRLAAVLVVALVLLVCYDVTMRYLFQAGSVALQELEWHLFALIFLLGAAYTLKHDEHVRVDVLYQARWMSAKRKAWVNLLGCALFLIPFAVLIIYSAWPFVMQSYQWQEGSPDPGGLPYRWAIKAAIPIGFALLALQAISLMIRSARTIWAPLSEREEHRQGL